MSDTDALGGLEFTPDRDVVVDYARVLACVLHAARDLSVARRAGRCFELRGVTGPSFGALPKFDPSRDAQVAICDRLGQPLLVVDSDALVFRDHDAD